MDATASYGRATFRPNAETFSVRNFQPTEKEREERKRERTEHNDTRFKLSRLWGADHYLDEPPGSLDKTRWGRSGRRANSPLSLCPYHTHSTDVLLPLRPLPSRSSFLSFPPNRTPTRLPRRASVDAATVASRRVAVTPRPCRGCASARPVSPRLGHTLGVCR